MEIFHQVVEMLSDGDRSSRVKMLYVGLLIALVLGGDFATGVITNLINGQKIDQLEKIESMLTMPTVDIDTKNYLRKKKTEIISRRSYLEWSSDFLSFTQNAIKSTRTAIKQQKKIENNTASIKIDPWVIYHTISSAWTIVLVMIATPFFSFKKSQHLFFSISVLLFQEFLLFCLVLVFAYAFAVIPIIGKGFSNIVINIFVHTCIVMFIGYLVTKLTKK